jgi:general secretion pathway protein D/MSHA biogenesis protein MshL
MKLTNRSFHLVAIVLLLLFASSCSNQQQTATEEPAAAPPAVEQAKPAEEMAKPETAKLPEALPTIYQKPAYVVDAEDSDLLAGDADSALKVGATIKSTRGPQPLWDILRRLAALKKMTVSWASDVDQNVLVDVSINANDDFFQAIDNLLRQVDYFHVMQGNTIVVKYKETRQFRIAMPFTRSDFSTGTGGNVLGSNDASSNIDGTIELQSRENTFDIWENIQANMDTIIALWNTEAVTDAPATAAAGEGEGEPVDGEPAAQATRQVSSGGVAYIIDKPVGIITVTAPRPLLDELDRYFESLTGELYKQIAIEAKIIEVHLADNSTIGLNWDSVLKGFDVTGTVTFGAEGNDPNGAYTAGQIWPYVSSNNSGFNDGTNHGNIYDPTRFITKIALGAQDFNVIFNAIKQQGDAQVLSNPKVSVMNGQPSLLVVGRNVTYIEKIETDLDTSGVTPIRTYTVDTARILSGVGLALTATILNDNEVVMNLVPVTSELQEPIEYRAVGVDGGEVGLPIINVREISTTVRVKDSEMLVIGGLISEVESTAGSFAPLLGQIPLARYLFGYEEKVKEKRELIILLKPKII